MKLAVIYDSKTGNTKQAAEWIAEGMRRIADTEAAAVHLGPVGVNDNAEKHNGMEHYRENFLIFGERFAQKAAELFK